MPPGGGGGLKIGQCFLWEGREEEKRRKDKCERNNRNNKDKRIIETKSVNILKGECKCVQG
jgi:hypothetical protein